MIRTATLVAALGAAALPAAAATVSADAFVTLTVIEATDGIDLFYEPFAEAFEESGGAGAASASLIVEEGTESAVSYAAETAASAAPPDGFGIADAFAFDTVFADNLSAQAGSVTFTVEFDLAAAADVGPGETAFAAAELIIFQTILGAGPDGDFEPVEDNVILELLVGAGNPGGLPDGPADVPAALAGLQTYVIEFAPFESQDIDIVVSAFSTAFAPIPLPAGGWLLLAGLGALGLRRRG